MGRMNLVKVLRVLLFLVVGFLVLYPLAMILIGSFRTEMVGVPGTWGITGWIEAYGSSDIWEVIWNTIEIAIIKTLIAVILSVAFAWAIHRTDMPGRRMLDIVLHLNFFLLPPLPLILGWMLIFSPKTGIANLITIKLFGSPLFNIYSMSGIIFVMLSFSLSFYYLFLSPAFKSMDTTLEEAARISGASGFVAIRKVVLPILMPAILAVSILSLIRGLEAFEAPFFLGGAISLDVLSTKIFDYMTGEPPNIRAAMAIGITLLAITFALIAIQWKILGSREFVTVTGKGYKPRLMSLGRWRWPAFISLAFVLGAFTIPPAIVVIQTTFIKVVGIYDSPDGVWTMKTWQKILNQPEIIQAIKNTLVLAVSVANSSVILVSLVAYIVVKTRFMERKALDLIAWIPWAVPGIVMGLALLWSWIFFKPFGFTMYGSLLLMIICMVTVGFPVGTKIMTSTIIQISSELEESARVSGASWTTVLLRIWVPLLKHSVVTVWLLQFVMSVRLLAPIVLIYSPKSRILSTVFYEKWYNGDLKGASVVGVLQAGIIIAGYLFIKLIGKWGGIKTEENVAG